jgi:hypothetical protein
MDKILAISVLLVVYLFDSAAYNAQLNNDWKKLVRRWEHTKVQSNLHSWTHHLYPICRSFFYNIFGIITHIHSKTYGPDHILTVLYHDLVKRLINPAALPLPESLAKKIPPNHIFKKQFNRPHLDR